MRLLAFSDLHRDLSRAEELAGASSEVDLVLAAGDFASLHEGLEETIGALAAIETPTIVVPGNNETAEALRAACRDWEAATVLHGESMEVDGRTFFGLGAGIPVTPWDWSFDLSEEEAAELLAACPPRAVMVLHSPPKGHCDLSGTGENLGSEAILSAIEAVEPPLAVCGHIHESWGCESLLGTSRVVNLGPEGSLIEV
jgi:Icc-related predicted phosphoesterase